MKRNLILLMMMLLAGNIFAQLNETFDTWPPADWTNNDGWAQYDGTGHEDSYSAKHNSSTDVTDAKLITPKLDVDGSVDLTYWYYGAGDIQVKYSTDKTNWTNIGSAVTLSYSWSQATVDLSALSGQYYFAFSTTKNAYQTAYIDDVAGPAIYTNPNPEIALSFASDFTATQAGNSSQANLTIENTGGSDMDVTGIDLASPFSADWNGTVAAGNSQTVTVSFDPTNAGTVTETVTVNYSGTVDGDNTIEATATGYASDAQTESFETAVPPDGWSANNWSQSTNAAYDETCSADNSWNSTNSIVTPKLDIRADDVLVFYAYSSYLNDITISYSSDSTSWDVLTTKTINTTSEWNEIIVDLSSVSGTHHLKFEAETYTYMDYFILPPTYVPSTPVVSLSLSENFEFIDTNTTGQVTLDIQNSGVGDMTITDISVAAPFSTDFSGNLVVAEGTTESVTATFAPASAGNYSETLTVTIQESYDGSNTINLQGSAYPAGYVQEGFEDEASGEIPTGWTEVDDDANYSWGVATFAANTGSNSIYRGSGDYTSTMYTPLLDMSSGDHYLYFYWKQSTTTGNDLIIKLSTDGGASYTTMGTLSGGTGDVWQAETVNLGTPASDQCIVAFEYTNASGYVSVYLDDIKHAAYNLSNITASGTGTWADIIGASDGFTNITIENGAMITVASAKATQNCYNLNIEPGGDLSVEGTLNIHNNLTVEADATGAGSLINTNTINVTGETKVQQHHATNAQEWNWHYVTAPVDGATADIFPGVDHDANGGTAGVYASKWDEGSETWTNITTADVLTSGTGYAIPNNGAVTVEYTGGTLTAGEQTISNLTNNGDSGGKEGFNLVGNPYTAALDVTSLIGTNWTQDVWIREDGNFIAYNAGGGTGDFTNIPAMQGFWVRVTDAGDITVNPNNLVHDAQTVYKENREDVLKLQVTNGELTDKATIYYNENATSGFENYDTEKMFAEDDAYPQIYTLADDKQVSINGIAPIEEQVTLALGFQTNNAGTFTLDFTNITDFNAAYNVYLKDNKTGDIVNLREASTYEFFSEIVDNSTRFGITISKGANGIEHLTEGMKVFSSNNTIFVNASAATNGTMTVYDVSGKVIKHQKVNINNGMNSFDIYRTNGVYLVNIKTDKNNISEKVIIR